MTNASTYLESLGPIDPSAMSAADARKAYRAFRVSKGWADNAGARLLTWPEENVKLAKSAMADIALSLAPAASSGHNVCNASTPECRAGCVATAGNGMYPVVKRGRSTKTQFLMSNPQAFVTLLAYEIANAITRYDGKVICRLNAFSDLRWEIIAPALFNLPVITFYDYTKRNDRDSVPSNYDITYSASEKTTPEQILAKVANGTRVAVVFGVTRKNPLPPTYLGIPVVDGDKSDARHLDPNNVVVGLRAKGQMRGAKTWKMVRQVVDTPVSIG